MKAEFNYFIPTRIIFGCGKLKELATTPYLPGKKALIVISSGTSMKKQGYLERVQTYLKENNVDSVVFDKILPNPIQSHVHEGAEIARANDCDFVLGLGGGSSIDSAKSIAIMATNAGEYWDYIGSGSGKGQPVQEQPLPIVAVTTTAGTGTEADPWTVITKTETNEKIGFGVDGTFPVLSIVDPELTVSVPPTLTAFQGMDAFFHASEGFLANIRQPLSDSFALDAIRLISENLGQAYENGSDLDARSGVAWANTLAGMVESTSCVISQHALAHALGAFYHDMPHGAALTALSVPYFTYIAQNTSEPERLVTMARVMGEDVDALPADKQPMAFITALKKLIKRAGQENLSLADYGFKAEDAKALAENAFDTMGFLFPLDPCEITVETTAEIFAQLS